MKVTCGTILGSCCCCYMKVPFNHNGVLEFHMRHGFIVGDKI